jgi:NADH:ubiquinone oxidoreductase subunit 3 (subunit A)
MEKTLFSPASAFVIVLIAAFVVSWLVSRLSLRPGKHTKNEGTSYACGEENYNDAAQPDYSIFFPFAFFFTIAHVATMIMTTVPAQRLEVFGLAVLYITGAVIGLYVLMRNR